MRVVDGKMDRMRFSVRHRHELREGDAVRAAPPLAPFERWTILVIASIGVATSVVLAIARGSEDVLRSAFEILLTAVFAGFAVWPAVTVTALAIMTAVAVAAGTASETLIALAVATGFAVRTGSMRLLVAFCALLLLSAPAAALSTTTTELSTIVIYLLLAAVSGAIGLVLRLTRGREQRLAQQLSRRALAEQEIRQSERLMIADELHDVVARDLTLIVMQTELMTLDPRPATARSAAETIRASARTALQELHRLVDRVNSERPVAESLDTLDAALDDARRALDGGGHSTTLTTRVIVSALPRLVETTLARMVRECATNIIKHGGPGPVTIDLDQSNGYVRLDVRNRMGARRVATPLPSSGYGHVRMAERASLLGGTYTSHLEGETWVARAEIPMR